MCIAYNENTIDLCPITCINVQFCVILIL